MENNHPIKQSTEQEDYLEAEANSLNQYEYGTQGQRFLNWLIDNILMRYGLSYLSGMLLGLVLGFLAPDFLQEAMSMQNIWAYYGIVFLTGYLSYLFYYTFCEKIFKGYTLGKIITGTRAIRQDGTELSFKDALLRSLCRLVPFEVFSGFSTLTWHDAWTNTMVVKSR